MTTPTVVVFSSINVTEVYLVRSLLTREGIASHIRGELRAGLGGEVPMNDARAELLVAVQFESAALEIMERVDAVGGPDWGCAHCGETSPSTFEICWRCARSRGPQEVAP